MRLRAMATQGLLTATRLYLVRHGQVADGHTDRYHGHNDVELSPTGIRQCEALAAHLQEVSFAGIYASDLTRTRQGAEIIGQGRGLPVQVVPAFREINFGIWEGLTFQEIMDRYPEELRQRFNDLANYRIPGGESLKDLEARLTPALSELRQRHVGQNFLVVAHAGSNRVILSQALNLDLNYIFRLDQAYAGLNIIDYYPDLAVVRLLNGIFYPPDLSSV
ncbi:MAG: alpha-ribazole phosphatase [Desulfobacca sp.]|uniref:alpha-ribazole phosphatase n=1 Tax=Desulfobacca sp. TaxID=2067990 RepID=UPI004049D420